jgi:hypothetical protein
MAGVGKKTHPTPAPPCRPPSPKPKKNRLKVNSQKRLTVVQCLLTQGQGPDEETQPIPSYRQNDELVHWWVLVHSGLQDDHKQCRRHLQGQVFCSSKRPTLIFLFPHDTLLVVGTHKMPTMYLSPKKKIKYSYCKTIVFNAKIQSLNDRTSNPWSFNVKFFPKSFVTYL